MNSGSLCETNYVLLEYSKSASGPISFESPEISATATQRIEMATLPSQTIELFIECSLSADSVQLAPSLLSTFKEYSRFVKECFEEFALESHKFK